MGDQDNIKAILKDSGATSLEQAIAKAREEVDRLENVVLSIAITGETGAGKSTFVNALRGVGDTDEEAAAVGETETTMGCSMFPHPTMHNVRIWDLPGIGSDTFKADTYLEDVNAQEYDFFIIINQKRFKENDVMLANEILKMKKKFYFVRTSIDSDIKAAKKRKRTEEQALQKVRQYCEDKVKELGSPVFLISSWNLEKYDFKELQQVLERDVPDLKRDALVLSLPIHSLQSLEKKYNTLKSKVWAFTVASGAMGIIPGLCIPVDFSIAVHFFKKCYFSFCLDDKSLTKLEETINKSIRKMVRESDLVRAIADNKLTASLEQNLGKLGCFKSLCALVPVLGSVGQASLSYIYVQQMLFEGLNELYKVAKNVIELVEVSSKQRCIVTK